MGIYSRGICLLSGMNPGFAWCGHILTGGEMLPLKAAQHSLGSGTSSKRRKRDSIISYAHVDGGDDDLSVP